jgi:hypothetical protein
LFQLLVSFKNFAGFGNNLVDFLFQKLFGGQFRPVFRHHNTVAVHFEQFNLFAVAFGTEQQADWLALAFLTVVAVESFEVKRSGSRRMASSKSFSAYPFGKLNISGK